MKYKKLFKWLFIAFGTLSFVVILCFTLFRVNKVSLNFRNETTIFASNQSQKDAIKSAKINYNIPIFAVNKNKIKENIESENYYIKVINIETVFPNKLIVHCVEREELYYIKSDEMYFVCDSEFKVLSETKDVTLSQKSACELIGLDVKNPSAKAGEYLEFFDGGEIALDLMNNFLANNRQASDVKAMFKSIEIYYDHNYFTKNTVPNLRFVTFDGFEIEVRNTNYLTVNKINLMLALIPECADKYATHKLILDINPDTNQIYSELKAKS